MDYEMDKCICVGSLVKCVLCQVFVVNREWSQKTLVYQFIYVCTFNYENKCEWVRMQTHQTHFLNFKGFAPFNDLIQQNPVLQK